MKESEWVCWIQWFWIHSPCLKKHIFSLRGFFQKYFPSNGAHYDGVRFPFIAAAPADFSSPEEDQVIKTMWLHTGWILAWCGEGATPFWKDVQCKRAHCSLCCSNDTSCSSCKGNCLFFWQSNWKCSFFVTDWSLLCWLKNDCNFFFSVIDKVQTDVGML